QVWRDKAAVCPFQPATKVSRLRTAKSASHACVPRRLNSRSGERALNSLNCSQKKFRFVLSVRRSKAHRRLESHRRQPELEASAVPPDHSTRDGQVGKSPCSYRRAPDSNPPMLMTDLRGAERTLRQPERLAAHPCTKVLSH